MTPSASANGLQQCLSKGETANVLYLKLEIAWRAAWHKRPYESKLSRDSSNIIITGTARDEYGGLRASTRCFTPCVRAGNLDFPEDGKS